MKLSEYIKEYRTSHRMSYRDMGKQCNVSHQYISRLENDEIKKPSLIFLSKIAHGMGVTTEELLTSVDDFAIDLSSDTEFLTGRNELVNRIIEKLNTLNNDELTLVEMNVDTIIRLYHK